MKFLLVLFSLFFVCSQGVAAPSDDLLAKLNSFKTMQANFNQEIRSDTGEVISSSSGVLKLTRNGEFYWEVLLPHKQLTIISDGVVTTFDPDLEQATQRKFDAAQDHFPAFLLTSNNSQLLHAFDVEKNANDSYVLTPKSQESLVKTITIIFSDAKIVGLKFEDNLGQVVFIKFTKEILNSAISSDVFHFSPPKNIDVVQL